MEEKSLFVYELIRKYGDKTYGLDFDELIEDPDITLEQLKYISEKYIKKWA